MNTTIWARRERILGRRITAHTFRHSFATWSQGQGVPLGKVSRHLGHSGVRTTAMFCDHSSMSPPEALGVASPAGRTRGLEMPEVAGLAESGSRGVAG